MTADIGFEDCGPGACWKARRITEQDIDRYAELTSERHPVHLDTEFARAAGFRGHIAHGLFALALVEGLRAETSGFERSVIVLRGWDKCASPRRWSRATRCI